MIINKKLIKDVKGSQGIVWFSVLHKADIQNYSKVLQLDVLFLPEKRSRPFALRGLHKVRHISNRM